MIIVQEREEFHKTRTEILETRKTKIQELQELEQKQEARDLVRFHAFTLFCVTVYNLVLDLQRL